MGTNISGMIFKCSSDQDDIENLVYKWIKDEDSFFDQQSTIHIEFLNNNLILDKHLTFLYRMTVY
jgi:hypothetical protein